jgi:hypothetical protein
MALSEQQRHALVTGYIGAAARDLKVAEFPPSSPSAVSRAGRTSGSRAAEMLKSLQHFRAVNDKPCLA